MYSLNAIIKNNLQLGSGKRSFSHLWTNSDTANRGWKIYLAPKAVYLPHPEVGCTGSGHGVYGFGDIHPHFETCSIFSIEPK